MAEVEVLQSIFLVQNYTENTNGYAPLTVGNAWHFWLLWIQGVHMFFLYKDFFYSMTLWKSIALIKSTLKKWKI